MAESPVTIIQPGSIPNPELPRETLQPVGEPSRKTTILLIAAIGIGLYGLYRMAKEDEELELSGEADEDEDEDDSAV